jgi:two-component system sensor histidine kinase AlgZ
VAWQRDAAADAALVPPFLLQPLVENAVFHGIEPGVGPGTVSITIARRGPVVHIEIANPLPDPTSQQPGNRMALDNIRERLMLFYDLEATLDTEQGPTPTASASCCPSAPRRRGLAREHRPPPVGADRR